MHPGTGSVYLQTQTFFGLPTAFLVSAKSSNESKAPGGSAVQTRDVISFKRPSKRGKGKMTKPETSEQHLSHLPFSSQIYF